MKVLPTYALILIAHTSQVMAEDLTFGIGSANIGNSAPGSPTFQIEYHSDPIWEFERVRVSAAVALQAEGNSTFYVGGGLSTIWNFAESWFVEGSLLAGYYDEGRDGVDLGSDLQFRSLVGIGYHLPNKSSVSFALDHLSNAGFDRINPGRESVTIRYSIPF